MRGSYIRCTANNRLVVRLEACVIGDAGVSQVDGDAFDLNGWTAAELSDTEDGVRLMRIDCSLEHSNGSFKFGRNFAFDDICACDRIVQSADGFPGGIEGFATERGKTGYENFHECGIPFL